LEEKHVFGEHGSGLTSRFFLKPFRRSDSQKDE
jgi:hypothetical protein